MAGLEDVDTSSIKPNSNKYRQENQEKSDRERLRAVVKKEAVASTKKPLSQKFADLFVNEDADDIKSYIVFDVVVPGIKNTILDVIEMAFFGTTTGRGKSKKKDRTDYKSYYGGRSSKREREERRDRRGDDKLDYRNIVLTHRDDAEEVVEQLHKRIEKHGGASIADLFDLIDEPSNYNDNNWGWTSKRDIGIRRISRGFLIDVEEAEYLD